MTHTSLSHRSAHRTNTLFSYIVGFALSILLTLGSFWVAPHAGATAALLIILGAILQLIVQLVFFLHLGQERGEGWNIGIGLFTVGIIGILVGGTLWIMQNLAHLHIPAPTTTDLYEGGMVSPEHELK